jgi:predicted ATP-dependent endonuclease of OLD family
MDEIIETINSDLKPYDLSIKFTHGRFDFMKNDIELSEGQSFIMNVIVFSNILDVIQKLYENKINFHKIILMEEPDRHLDPLLIEDFLKIVKEFSKEYKIIMTTHRIDTIQLADEESIFTLETDNRNKFLHKVVKCHKRLLLYRLIYKI